MKQEKTRKYIIYGIILLIIIFGIVMVAIKGFNVDLRYQSSKMIELYIEDEFNIEDIKQMTDEVFGDSPVIIQKVEMFEDTVAIRALDITDEQKSNMVQKVNEKYSLELSADDITIETIPSTRLRDIIKPYVLPVVIATLIILLYLGIRYYKLGVIKTILKAGIIAIVCELLLFSVIALTRIPIGRYTIPLMLLVYLGSMFGITTKFEKDLANKKAEKEETEIQD